jgi:hypothetical protein
MSYGITLNNPPRFRDVPQFTKTPSYAVDISWDELKSYMERHPNLDLDPDFQRGHVWNLAKQVAYVEFSLRGGDSARNVYLNCPNWPSSQERFVLVDGKQRLTAVLGFLNDKVPVFGGYLFSHFADKLRMTGPSFRWNVNDLPTRAEVLQWYLELNTGGVVHTSAEIKRVQALLAKEQG